ncbi:GGDEF domain-containing protein [Luteimonas sp. MC1572]|uniref:GGDEF domain-containing protein n=1 Tax=Luteimonas sp. MC1572 TaxID=2799325 RepID=UPI0018F05BD4|nr:GGDEF domain-containing protein [Luteimonas sp. MC1572]MBJ6982110.1 GGDEF domain-containing protein [Luteimonas sp. MC1572]QQO03403.1 GGDEF domain-containing protein [Luteimonas sp. MC1572]
MRVLLGCVLAAASAGALAATCADIEAEALVVAEARDSDPAQGVARGQALLADVQAMSPPCPAGEAMLLGGIASNLHILGRNHDAVRDYRQAIAMLGSGTPAQLAFLHRGLSVALVELESYGPALEHALVALEASDVAADTIGSAKTAGNIGNLYNSIGELDLARDYHGRSLAGFEATGFKPGIAGTLVNLGSVAAKAGLKALEANDADRAREQHLLLRGYNERARGIFAELGNLRGVAYADSNIGLALDRLGQPKAALSHHTASLAARRKLGDLYGTINSLLSIASAQAHSGRGDAAATTLDEVEALIPEDAFNLKKEVAAQRVLLGEARGDFRAALAAQREFSRLAALAADADQRSAIAALQDRFDSTQAAREIESLRNDAELSALQLRRQRQVSQLGILAAVLATGLLLLLWSRLRIGISSSRQLSVAARTDYLTALPNRRHLLELMQVEVHRVERGGSTFCLVMADLDDFKAINDRHGHDAGDTVLREVARRLRDAVRKQDSIARWGGEEFLLLLPDSRAAGAASLADKLRQRVSAEPILVGPQDTPVSITLTMGYSEYRPGTLLDACIKAADTALFEGKRKGKDRVMASPASGKDPDIDPALPVAETAG